MGIQQSSELQQELVTITHTPLPDLNDSTSCLPHSCPTLFHTDLQHTSLVQPLHHIPHRQLQPFLLPLSLLSLHLEQPLSLPPPIISAPPFKGQIRFFFSYEILPDRSNHQPSLIPFSSPSAQSYPYHHKFIVIYC